MVTFRLLSILLILAFVLPGCLISGQAEKSAIHNYRLASDATVTRVTADQDTPEWVKKSAVADNEAFLAIDALFQGKKVEEVRKEREQTNPAFIGFPPTNLAPPGNN